jgi:hypothetical protein
VRKGDNFHYCFLDEKWFYTTSRRSKNKIIPKTRHETEEDAKFNAAKIRSCRFATKLMFMGVVSPPNKEHPPPSGGYISNQNEILPIAIL